MSSFIIKMYRLLAMLVLLSAAVAQDQSDIDTLIDSIFEPKNNNTPAAAADGPVQKTTGSVDPATTVPPESCVTRNNEAGECVRYYLCNETQTKTLDDELSIIDIHGGYDQCSSYLDTCCTKANQVTISSITTSVPKTSNDEAVLDKDRTSV